MIAKRTVYTPDLEAAEVGRVVSVSYNANPGSNQLWARQAVTGLMSQHTRLPPDFERIIREAVDAGIARGVRYATAAMYEPEGNQKIERAHSLLLYADRLVERLPPWIVKEEDFNSAAEFLTEALPG